MISSNRRPPLTSKRSIEWMPLVVNFTLLLALSGSIYSVGEAQGEHSHAAKHSDLCKKSWLHLDQKCYKLLATIRNSKSAKSKCEDLSSRLAFVDDVELSKEEEYGQGETSATKRSVQALIAHLEAEHERKPELQVKHYFVNISQDLLGQFLERKRRGYYNDSSIRDNSDTAVSNLWLSPDDPTLISMTANISNQPESEIAFVLTYSQKQRRVGLVPVNASRKFAFVCEMNVLDPQQSASSLRQGLVNSDPRREPQIIPAPSSPEQSRSQLPNSNLDQANLLEKDSSTTTTVLPETTSVLFREFPQDLFIVLGSTAEMRCSALDAESNVVWTFDGRNLTQSNRVRLYSNGTLKIEHVRNVDVGTYTCSIYSSGIHESKSARLEIIERPLQPEYITAELLDKSSTSVRIKWTPGFNGNSPILKYLIEMRTVNRDGDDGDSSTSSSSWETAKANISADQTSVIIADLKPARKYVFRIKATNRVGTGDPSSSTNPPIEVPVQPPSMPPENLTGNPESSTSIKLHWSPPPADSQNGVIKGYKIRHKLADYATDTDWYVSNAPVTAHLSFILDDLINWQTYDIQIAAENDKGIGPYSSSIRVRTREGKPDRAPQLVSAEAISPTTIKVNWNPPPRQHINGNIQGYRVQIYTDPQHNQLFRDTSVSHSTLTPIQTTTIDGLSPYTTYYVAVRCHTNAGDGPANDNTVKVKTKEDLPEAVPTLEFADVLDKTLRLLWRPPNRINGELNHYTIEYSETASPNKKILKHFSADVTEAKITDLHPQTPYTFKIYPYTNVGQGPGLTNSTTTSVPPVAPNPPSNLVASNIGPHSVTIHFSPFFDGNASIEKWVAEALIPPRPGSLDTARWHEVYTSTNHSQGNSVVVKNLQPHTRYRIRLLPFNVVGSSRYPSEPSEEFQTAQVEPEQPPRDLSIDNIQQNSVVAHWSPLSNHLWLGNPLGYNLTWSENNNSTLMHHFINDTRADSWFVKDLEEFTEYTFKIYAVNEAGRSPPSDPVTVTTHEDVPSAGPSNLTAQAISSSTISVSWNQIPKRHRNGLIRGYKIQYQAVKTDAPLQHKTVEDGSARHISLNDLKPFTFYKLAVAGYTSAGDGVYSGVMEAQTLEDAPGKPQNLTFPTVTQTSARVLWDAPEDPNGNILGYKVSWYPHTVEGTREVVQQELQHNERTFKAMNLKPDTAYVFTVTAKTKEGWGEQSSRVIYTYDSQLRANLPFYKEGWFVILCACLSVVVTVIVTALLFVQTKSYKYKQDAMKSTSHDRLGDAGFTVDDEANSHYNNGFGLLTQNANHRRSNGALSQSTANFTLPKSPPRPHPGSVIYSDDGDDDVFEDVAVKQPHRMAAGTSNQDSSGDSLTEKPSEISSSTAPDSESADDEYINMANKHFVNHYANVNGTLRGQKVWKKQGKTYSSHRTKPKLPHRPVPSVPQVPAEPGSSSSEANSGQPTPGTSGLHSSLRPINAIYGNSNQLNPQQQHQQQQLLPPMNMRNNSLSPNQQPQATTSVDEASVNSNSDVNNLNTQQTDLLNGHIVSLNGGRIIVDNMAGSRAPLPGFTSFV